MGREDIVKHVQAFLESGLADTTELSEDTDLFELGLLDSLKIVSLVVFVEEHFRLSLDYDDLTEEHLGSIGAIADLVVRKAESARAGVSLGDLH